MFTMIKVTSIISSLILASSVAAQGAGNMKVTVQVADASNNHKFGKELGLKSEGASVNANGEIFAVNGSNVINLSNNNVVLRGPGSADTNPTSWLASSRWLPNGELIAGDAVAHKVWIVKNGGDPAKPGVLVEDTKNFLQPNDMALKGCKDKIDIYFSGMNWTADSLPGEHGEIGWTTYKPKEAIPVKLNKVPKDVLAKAGIYRTNGIEVIKNPQTKKYELYVTSAQNKASDTIFTKIFRLELDDHTGEPKNPKEVLDIRKRIQDAGLTVKAGMDPDGMRTDTKGNLYITLNAVQKVMRWNPFNNEIYVVDLKTVEFPTNLEFGGPDGTSLYVVGKCVGNKSACIDVLNFSDKPVGKAWKYLNLQKTKVPRGETGRMFAASKL